jgi:hypothetical protein
VKDHNIDVLWLEDNNYQPFDKKGARSTILSLEEPILEAHWIYLDNAHVVVRTKDGIFLTEVEERGGRNTVELVTGKTDELKTLPDEPKAVFYRREKTWSRIEL